MGWPEFKAQFSSTDFASGRATLALTEVWQQGCHGSFDSVTNTRSKSGLPQSLRLHYSYWLPNSARAVLVLIPGRIEAGHKYLELIHEALCAGFAVFVLDHQGQGASERLDSSSQIGDVADFNHYVADLEYFICRIIKPQTALPLLALAHSMGGGILCRYLQQHPNHGLAGAIFCSPMWGIPTGPIPQQMARGLSNACNRLNQWCCRQRWYVPGQGPYQNRPFQDNDLTRCAERYQWFRSLYQQYPAYQLGGVSWRWLAQALTACQQMLQGDSPSLPCLLLQAAADQVVDNKAQQRLWQRFRQTTDWHPASIMHQLPDARHELLFETDAIREQVLSLINQFLKQLELPQVV